MPAPKLKLFNSKAKSARNYSEISGPLSRHRDMEDTLSDLETALSAPQDTINSEKAFFGHRRGHPFSRAVHLFPVDT